MSAPMPSLIWCLIIEGLGGQAVQCLIIEGLGGRAFEQVNNDHHHLTLVDCQHPSLFEGVGDGHHRLVVALNDVILL